MKDISFVWDPRKNLINQTKHDIGFDEAKTVFFDEYARVIFDPLHSTEEDRFIILGLSSKLTTFSSFAIVIVNRILLSD